MTFRENDQTSGRDTLVKPVAKFGFFFSSLRSKRTSVSRTSTPRYLTTVGVLFSALDRVLFLLSLFPRDIRSRNLSVCLSGGETAVGIPERRGGMTKAGTDERGGKTLPDRWSGNAVTRLVARPILMRAISQPSGAGPDHPLVSSRGSASRISTGETTTRPR